MNDPAIITKHCPRCGRDLALEHFSRSSNPSHKHGRQGWCKRCVRDYGRELNKIVVRR